MATAATIPTHKMREMLVFISLFSFCKEVLTFVLRAMLATIGNLPLIGICLS